MADKNVKKAIFDAVYQAELSGNKLSQGAVNKLYDQALGKETRTRKVTVGIPAGSYTQHKPTYNEPVDNRTTQQKFDDAQKAYDSYMGSDERKQSLGKVNLQTAIQQLFNVAGGPTSDALPGSASAPTAPQDAKERELSATVEHYRQQLQAEEDQRIMDADLKELESWSEEDRNNLNRYIAERDQHAYNSLNPMIGPQFDTYNLNPIVEKYGIDKVRRMAESVQRGKNEETIAKVEEAAQNTANNKPWLGGTLGSIASVGTNLAGAITGPLGYVVEAGQRTGRYSTLDPNNLGNLPSVYGETVRSEVAQNIRGDEDSTNWLRKLAALGYQGGMSVLDSGARLLASGGSSGISSAIAASGAFGNGLRQYSQQGAAPEQAAAMALTSAGLEYITEKLPTEKVLSMFKKGNTKNAVREVLTQAFLVEPTSEEVNLFAGVAAETLILGDKSSKSQRVGELIANGMSYEEAQAQVWKELWNEAAQTYAVSAISGGLSSAGATVIGNNFIEATGKELAEKMPKQEPPKPLTKAQQLIKNAAAQLFGVANRQSVVDTVSTERYDKNRTQEGGNFDVGREVRENQNWPINQSGSGIRGAEVARESGTGNSQISGEGSISGRGGEVFQGGDYSVEYDDEYDHYDGRPTKDGAGNEISGETAKRLAGTTVLDKNNAPIAVFHGTPNMEFTAFEQGDSGFHFGNYEQAKRRIEGKNLEEGKRSKAGRVFRTYLNIKNPIYAEDDIGSWDAPAVAMLLETYGVLNTDEANSVKNLQGNGTGYNSPAAVQLRNLMDAKGYDGIVYPNYIEGKGDSYMVFHNDQIVQSNIQYLDDDGNAYADASGSRYKDPKTGKPVIKGTGAAEQNFSGKAQYQDLLYEGNVQRDRQGDVRPMEVPKTDIVGNPVSAAAANVYGSKYTTDDLASEMESAVGRGELSYIEISNDTASQMAAQKIENAGGWEYAYDQWHTEVRDGKAGAELSARGAMLLNHAAEMYEKIKATGNEDAAKAAKQKWMLILMDVRQMGTNTAQGLQAMRLIRKLAPPDKLDFAVASVNRMVADMKLQNGLQIDENLLNEYRMAETDEQRSEIMGRIQKNVADQIPSTFLDKWTALRYMNMLGNLKTNVRNVAGNIGSAIAFKMKNQVAAGVEDVISLFNKNFQRTKSHTVNATMLKAAREDFNAVKGIVNDGGKYSDRMAADSEFVQGVMDKRRIFKSNAKNEIARKVGNVIMAPAEGYRRATNWMMNNRYFGDEAFGRAAYARALAGYLKANGIKNSDLSTVDQTLMDKARAYAIKEAQEATFHDNSALAQIVSKVQKSTGVVGQAIMPFTKTPANVLVRATEFSPIGILNTAYRATQAAAGRTGLTQKNGMLGDFARSGENITGADIVNSLAKTITGTGLFALGALLWDQGILSAGPSDDEEEKVLDELSGKQPYSLQFAGEDETVHSYTMDWLTPVAMPMFMGAEFWKMIQEADGEKSFADYEELFTSIADPMIQMSMLQGLNDSLDSIRYAENNLGQFFINAAVNYLSQGVTNTLFGQIERTTEENRQTTYIDENSALPKWAQMALGKASQKIPGWDFQQMEYRNRRGETEENEGGLLYNLLSPGYTSAENSDAVMQELYRLKEAQTEKIAPKEIPKKVSYTDEQGVEHKNEPLTQEQYQTLATTQGQTAKRLLDKLIKSKDYKVMTDSQKAAAVNAVYEYAAEAGKKAALPDYYSNAAGWIKEATADPTAAVVNKIVTADLSDAMGELVGAWKNKESDEEAVTELENTYQVYKNLSSQSQKAIMENATGRLENYLNARKTGIDSDTFADLYKYYWQTSESNLKAGEKAQRWAYQLELAQEAGKITEAQKNTLKDSMTFFQTIPAETAKFDELTRGDLSATAAQNVVRTINNLLPEEGYKEVRDVQELDAIIQMTLSDLEKETAMRAYMSDKQEEKLDEVLDMGFSVEDYPQIYRIVDAYTSGTGKKARTIKYLQKEYGLEYAVAKKLYEVWK